MMLETIINNFIYTGSFVLMIGIIALSSLQLIISRRIKKSLFTFLSVIFYPNDDLAENEIMIKKIGVVATVVGAIIILISGLGKYLLTGALIRS